MIFMCVFVFLILHLEFRMPKGTQFDTDCLSSLSSEVKCHHWCFIPQGYNNSYEFYRDAYREVVETGNKHTLYIKNAQNTHSGIYTCGQQVQFQLKVTGESKFLISPERPLWFPCHVHNFVHIDSVLYVCKKSFPKLYMTWICVHAASVSNGLTKWITYFGLSFVCCFFFKICTSNQWSLLHNELWFQDTIQLLSNFILFVSMKWKACFTRGFHQMKTECLLYVRLMLQPTKDSA